MNFKQLNDQLKALQKLEAQAARKGAQERRSPFGEWMESQEYYQRLSEAEKGRLRAEVELWFHPDAVEQRAAEYAKKVTDKEERRPDVFDLRAVSNEVCEGFAKMFGHSFNGLPFFQQDMLRMMCAIHLGVHLKGKLHCALERPFNLNKGIFVAGQPQIGKTSVFVYLKRTPHFRYRIVTSEQLRKEAEHYGGSVIDNYAKGQTLVIDEVGWEQKAKCYGNTIDVVAEVIHARHANGLRTHMTSNMTLEDLEGRYEPHIIARIKNSCNVLYATDAQSIEL